MAGARVGKILVGGGAVLIGYKIGNSVVDTWNSSSRYTPRKINQRQQLKPSSHLPSRDQTRQDLSAAGHILDILVVDDCGGPRPAWTALDAASRGLKVGILATQDFCGTSQVDPRLPSYSCHPVYDFLPPTYKAQIRHRNSANASPASDFDLLRSAPHLTSVTETVVLASGEILHLIVSYLGNRLADLLQQKPPKLCSRLLSPSRVQSPDYFPWLESVESVGPVAGVAVQEVVAPVSRLTMATVLSAVGWGARALNHCHVLKVETIEGQDVFNVSVEDSVDKQCFVVKCRSIVQHQADKSNRRMSVTLPEHLNLNNKNLIDPNAGIYMYGNEIVLENTRADPADIFLLARQLVGGRYYSLTRGEVATVERVEDNLNNLELTLPSGESRTWDKSLVDYLCSLDNFKPARKKQMSDILLEGSHGYYPNLPIELHGKYGFTYKEVETLVGKYGDRAESILELAQTLNADTASGAKDTASLRRAEIFNCVREMAVTVTDVLQRLDIKDEVLIGEVASVLQAELNWSRAEKSRMEEEARQFLKENKLNKDDLLKPRDHTLTLQQIEPSLRAQLVGKFTEIKGKTAAIKFAQLKNVLSDHVPPVNDEALNLVLKMAELERHGELALPEFLFVMEKLRVVESEQVVEEHTADTST